MHIERKKEIQKWGELDVSLFGATEDWHGEKLSSPVGFSFVIDPKYFWFIVTHGTAANIHPKARPNHFVEELWRYDVAEFFLTNPVNGRYLEFNLAPNGAWWAAEFTGPRKGMGEAPLQGVETFHELAADGCWLTAARFELSEFKERFALSPDSTINAAFILNSPEQKFVSVTKLKGKEPDFHQPDQFKQVNFIQDKELKKLLG